LKPAMKKSLIIGFLGVSITIVLAMGFSDLFVAWELKTLDARFKIRGPIETDPNIIMIDADDASAKEFGRWPWNRNVHVAMLDLLNQGKAGAVLYDVLFAQSTGHENDLKLIRAAKELALFPVAVELSEEPEASVEGDTVNTLPVADGIPKNQYTQRYLNVNRAIHPFLGLGREVHATGHIASNRDIDGVIRRVPLLVRYKGTLLPALGLQAVLNYLDISFANVEVSRSSILLKEVRLPGEDQSIDIRIPVDSKGQMLINYAGRWEDTFKHASFASVLSEEPANNGEDLTGKLVLVSNTLSGHDIKSIPLEKDYPGSGIHANIVNTILTRSFLKQSHHSTNHTLILLLSLGTALIFGRRNYFLHAAGILLLAGSYVAFGVWAFHAGIVLPMLSPILSIFITALLVAVIQASTEKKISDTLQHEKTKVESHLESIISDLARKEEELKEIQDQLSSIQEGVQKGQEQGKTQGMQIEDLQEKLQLLTLDKEDLLAQRAKLEDKVLDLRVHISFDSPIQETLQPLKIECERFGINTNNPSVLEVFKNLKQVAQVPSPVLILGDSGTGKEVFARALHELSQRSGEFVPVNMGAIPEGLYESELFGHLKGSFTGATADKKGKFTLADGGTIFLDEIGEIRQDLQVKLLRVLQEKEVQPVGGKAFKVNIRVVAATNRNLKKEMEDGEFRQDLFYRLNTVTFNLPPLKERKEDIENLTTHLIEKYRVEYGKQIKGISDKAMQALLNYDWPGNIRELENIIQRGITFASGELIQEKDLGLDSGIKVKEIVEPSKKPKKSEGDELLLNALRENKFEINSTALQLNMHRNTVTARFKGICFEKIVRNQYDLEQTAEDISGDQSLRQTVLQMITEYQNNLMKTIGEVGEVEEAVKVAIRKNKNVPAQYHSSIRELVRNGF